jgi:hypothetical protein
MGVLFTAASSQYLETTDIPATTYPITMGFWCQLTAADAVARTLACLTDTGTTNNYFSTYMTSGEFLGFRVQSSLNASDEFVGQIITAGNWSYVLCRFISSSSRRISFLQHQGIMSSTADGIGVTPTGVDTMTIGALRTSSGMSQFWDGKIAEFFVSVNDAAVTNSDPNIAFVSKLSREGPFSIPMISSNVRFYASFRDSVNQAWIANRDSNGLFAPTTLTESASSPTLVDHPPLSATYERPRDRRPVTIFV